MFKKLVLIYLIGFIYQTCVFALDKKYCKCRAKVTNRIVGGQVSGKNSFPWQISIGVLPDTPWELKPFKYQVGKREKDVPENLKMETHVCGGAILSQSLVLTAAHCVTDTPSIIKNANSLGVGFGNQHNLIDIYNYGRIKLKKIYVHPGYNVSNKDTIFDVAVLRLSQPLNFESESVHPACFLQENGNDRKKDYKQLIVSGWGSTNVMNYSFLTKKWSGYKASKQLKEATFIDTSKTSSICRENPRLICAASIKKNQPNAVCKGDSGGPIHFVQYGHTFVVGLTSFGTTKRSGLFSIQTCAGEAGYTRIQSTLDWIKSVVGNEMCLYEEIDNDKINLI